MKLFSKYSKNIVPCILVVIFLLTPEVSHANVITDVLGSLVSFAWEGIRIPILTALWLLTLAITGLVLLIGGLIFDTAVNWFVIGFADMYINGGFGFAVELTWVTIRDMVNLLFIFGLVYIGFKMILGTDTSNTRTWLVQLIIAALLINFSLFITKAIIDFSNTVSTEILASGMGAERGSRGLYEVNISDTFFRISGVPEIFDFKLTPDAATGESGFTYIFGTGLVFLVAGFTLFAAGMMLTVRFALLCFFLALSPVMFVGWILPPLAKYSSEYWSRFMKQVFFAPAYFIFLFISLQILKSISAAMGGNESFQNLGQAFGATSNYTPASTGISAIPMFILVCIFMFAALAIAQKVGADGANMTMNVAHSIRKKVQRQTAGRAGAMATRWAGGKAEKYEASLNRKLGKLAQSDSAAMRRLARVGDRTVGAGLRRTQNASVAGFESYASRNDRVKEQNVRLNQMDSDREREERRENAERALAAANNNLNTLNNNASATDEQKKAAKEALKTAEAAMAAAIKEMTNDELIEMAGSEEGQSKLTSDAYAKHLSDAQIKALKESGIYSNLEINKIKQAREDATFKGLEDVLEDTGASATELNQALEELGKTVKGLSEERLQNTKIDRLTDTRFASHLSDAQIESLEKSGKFTAQQIQSIKAAREAGLNNRINGTITNRRGASNPNAQSTTFTDRQRAQILSGSPQEIGKLPVSVFTNPKMASSLTPAMIEQRMKNGVTKEDLAKIKTNIDSHLNTLTDAQKGMWTAWEKTTYGAQFFSS